MTQPNRPSKLSEYHHVDGIWTLLDYEFITIDFVKFIVLDLMLCSYYIPV